MQHGTGREFVADILENVEAVIWQEVQAGEHYGDLLKNLQQALDILKNDPNSLDEPGLYGPDYGFPRVTEAEKAEAQAVREATGNGS